jgi:hypothetical protein
VLPERARVQDIRQSEESLHNALPDRRDLGARLKKSSRKKTAAPVVADAAGI